MEVFLKLTKVAKNILIILKLYIFNINQIKKALCTSKSYNRLQGVNFYHKY